MLLIFKIAIVPRYSNEEMVQYLFLELLWGQEWYQELRFVRVIIRVAAPF
ncbi:hypothetical protein [Paenibacillus sp. AD87]|nr:hypothetical protein [Paenibacillus sp. AD87]